MNGNIPYAYRVLLEKKEWRGFIWVRVRKANVYSESPSEPSK
jgi:hypothetical protein